MKKEDKYENKDELENEIGNKKEKNKKKKKRGVAKKILLFLLLVILVTIGILAYKVHQNGGGLSGLLATAIGHNQETRKNLPKMYCLLLGKSLELTDTIIVAEYDPQYQQASMLSIPRDTFVGTSRSTATPSDKINSIYCYSPEKLLRKVNELTGLNIKYYLTVDTSAFREIVDAVGGVTFNVPIDMKYDSNWQKLHINLKAGEQLLDGDKAEQLVRFRHNNDGSTYPYSYGMEDLGRMKTQREFLKALAKKTLSFENIFKINEFLDIAKKYVETNMDFDAIKDYIPYAVDFKLEDLQAQHLPGAPEYANTYSFYFADEAETAEIIDKFFLNPVIEDNVDTSEIDTSGIEKDKIKVEILNGSNSVTKLERIKKRIEKAGYTIQKTSDIAITERTVIINRGDIAEAVQEELKLLAEAKTLSSGEKTEVDVTIIIGSTDK